MSVFAPTFRTIDVVCRLVELVAAQKPKREWIGIDVLPTACRVMAKRLRDVCGLPEDEALWKAGRGFVVRDLPWTEEKLRAIPPFEFEDWAVVALGGHKDKPGRNVAQESLFPAFENGAVLDTTSHGA